MCTVDVIIPAYNCSETIQNTISSIQHCQLPDYSIIIVDDGSTDNTAQVCMELTQKYDNISYYYQENSGVSAARNKGLGLAKGQYILFVDADDILLPFSADILQTLKSYSPDILMFGMIFEYYIRRKTVFTEPHSSDICGDFSSADIVNHWSELFYKNYFSPVWNKYFKRELLLANNIWFDTQLTNYEDLAFSLNALRHSHRVYVSSECFYLYRNNYGYDRTDARIARIDDIIGNTTLVINHLAALESFSTSSAGIPEIQKSMLEIYLDIFLTKMFTTSIHGIKGYCIDFLNNPYYAHIISSASSLSKNGKRLLYRIQKMQATRIYLNCKYLSVRHFFGKTIRRTVWSITK